MSGTEGEVASLYTVGHSNHSLETFLQLLKAHDIQVLIDTRSFPFSRFAPHFNRHDLKHSVEAEGIKYGFYGKELGGRPDGEEFYDADGHVLYSQVAKSWLFNDGLERLMRGVGKYRVALLCSEEDPSVCHRRLLVSRVLAQQGVRVLHIRGDGRLEAEEDLQRQDDMKKASEQPKLFEDDGEVDEWRSLQSVSHKARLPSSSVG